MKKESESRGLLTSKEAANMTFREKVKRYAEDVLKTKNNPEFLGMSFQFRFEKRQAEYPAGKGEYTHSFLFGGGAPGHPLQPSIIGEGVYKVAELVGAKVIFLDFTFASFEKQINEKAIRKAFYPIFANLKRITNCPQQPVPEETKQRYLQQARVTLSKIKLD